MALSLEAWANWVMVGLCTIAELSLSKKLCHVLPCSNTRYDSSRVRSKKNRYTFFRKQSFSFLQFWCVNKVSLSTGKWKKLCTADDFAWFVAWMFTGQFHASVKHRGTKNCWIHDLGQLRIFFEKFSLNVMSWLSLALKPLTISEEKRRLFETFVVLEI